MNARKSPARSCGHSQLLAFAACGSACAERTSILPSALPDAAEFSGIDRTSAELDRAEALERVAVRRQHLSFRSPLPYFHNGFAKDLWAAVDFYDTRFNIGFTKQERADLVAFLASL